MLKKQDFKEKRKCFDASKQTKDLSKEKRGKFLTEKNNRTTYTFNAKTFTINILNIANHLTLCKTYARRHEEKKTITKNNYNKVGNEKKGRKQNRHIQLTINTISFC